MRERSVAKKFAQLDSADVLEDCFGGPFEFLLCEFRRGAKQG